MKVVFGKNRESCIVKIEDGFEFSQLQWELQEVVSLAKEAKLEVPIIRHIVHLIKKLPAK